MKKHSGQNLEKVCQPLGVLGEAATLATLGRPLGKLLAELLVLGPLIIEHLAGNFNLSLKVGHLLEPRLYFGIGLGQLLTEGLVLFLEPLDVGPVFNDSLANFIGCIASLLTEFLTLLKEFILLVVVGGEQLVVLPLHPLKEEAGLCVSVAHAIDSNCEKSHSR